MELDKHILWEHFAGRSTPLGKQQIEEWLRVPGNIERYYEWLDEWERRNPQFVPDTGAALDRVLQEPGGQRVTRKVRGMSRVFRFRLLAASVAALVLVTAAYLLRDRSMSTAYGETRSVILPDGSLVSMNANSTIRYSRFGFGQRGREVFLSGEADFTVTRDGNQPFEVTTGKDLHVVVLGTRFTVYARAGQERVVLRQGKVRLDYRDEQKILQPGDLFTADADGRFRLEHISAPENLSAWKDHEFLFDGTSMSEVAGMIRDNFGLTVRFDPTALASRRITGSFHADTVTELLDVMAQLLNIHYTIREDTIYFSE
ncbi:FecR family protein [Dinghuibacter silviterrae]|uniref:FecR family protein n=1 Tax=Dinghuibacter silviterrae TaxID=1539049 RepID=A0A4R8DJJ4_9BACT|nr:FecR domain-containing protein [Dinghuibacter silviterrae]TDW97484.1 FecR family protein [Dinghuibacter silviterrae]